MNILLLLAMPLVCCVAHAAEYTVGAITVDDIWARPTPPGVANGASYFALSNSGAEPDRLLGAASEIAERVEIHNHIMDEGIMRMRKVDAVDVPAGGSVNFAPGGLHIMFLGLKEELVPGESFSLTLTFEQGGEITVPVVIEHR